MRVAYIIPHLHSPSGWRSLSLGIIRAMQHQDVDPLLVVSKADAEAASTFLPDCDQVVCARIQETAVHLWRTWPDLARTWWTLQQKYLTSVQLVHSLAAYPTGLVGHWLAQKLSIPHIITIAGTYGVIWHQYRFDNTIYGKVLRQADTLCPISEGTYTIMRAHYGAEMAHTKHRVILLGTDYQKKVPATVAKDRKLPQKPTLLTVGAVKPRKGHHLSIKAFAQVKKVLPDAQYLIVGSVENTAYMQQLETIIAQTNLKDVHFWGVISAEQLDQCYQDASAFVLTSQHEGANFEGFGLVYLEAGAYGLPVIAARSGGIPDAVKDGETGILVDPNDVEGISKAMLTLLTNQQLNQTMGMANRRWAEHLTWERFAEEQTAVYQQLIQT